MSVLTKDSFSWHLKKTIGRWLDYWLVERFEDFEEDEYSRYFPVKALFLWVQDSGGVLPEEFKINGVKYLDDKGDPLPTNVDPTISGIEQLAIYGLWLLEEEMDCCGPSTEEDWDENRQNLNGFTEVEIIKHKAECLLLAYQCLSFIQRLQNNTQITPAEREITVNVNKALKKARSQFAFRGAKERHARDPKQADRNFVFECWKDWRQKPEAYKSKAAFARDMLEKCEKLESQKVIEDWCRQWEKEN